MSDLLDMAGPRKVWFGGKIEGFGVLSWQNVKPLGQTSSQFREAVAVGDQLDGDLEDLAVWGHHRRSSRRGAVEDRWRSPCGSCSWRPAYRCRGLPRGRAGCDR